MTKIPFSVLDSEIGSGVAVIHAEELYQTTCNTHESMRLGVSEIMARVREGNSFTNICQSSSKYTTICDNFASKAFEEEKWEEAEKHIGVLLICDENSHYW